MVLDLSRSFKRRLLGLSTSERFWKVCWSEGSFEELLSAVAAIPKPSTAAESQVVNVSDVVLP